ncbi:MAG: DNA-binding protein, partial [Pedobacter sp.]
GLTETVEYIKTHQDVVEKRYEYSENGEHSTKASDDFSF